MSYDYYTSSSDEDDGNYFTECRYCGCQLLQRNFQRHLDNVHKCQYCSNYMPKDAIASHVQRKHMTQCRHCSGEYLEHDLPQHELTHFTKCEHCQCKVLATALNQHLAESHPFRATVGMIRLEKISDNEFNRLINQNRVYAKDGHLFLK